MTKFAEPAQWLPAMEFIVGDVIRFQEGVFGGGSTFRGNRTIEAAILAVDTNKQRGIQTLTMRVIDSDGVEALKTATQIIRRKRAIKKPIQRLMWVDEVGRLNAPQEERRQAVSNM